MTTRLPNNEPDERAVCLLIADGDEKAFRQLYQQLLPHLAATGIKLLKSQDRVSEVLQETLIRIWIHREKLREVQSPRAWVYRVFSNECFRYLKKHGHQHMPLEMALDAGMVESINYTEQVYSMHETRLIIHNSVTSLSPRQREIYMLSREQGLKVREIATRLSLTYRYVKKTLSLALHHIRQDLIKAGKFYFLVLLSNLF